MKTLVRVLFILTFGLVCSTTTFIYSNHSSNNRTLVPATINTKNEIQKDVVVEKLSNIGQIVGLQSSFSKVYNYSDSNSFGSRSIEMTLHGTFKMGFDVKDLIGGISINDTTIKINTPKPILISFESPFDAITLDSKVGFFRKDFNDSDLQVFYKSAADKAKLDLLNNANLMLEAQRTTKKVVQDLLMTIPNVSKVEFN